MQSNESGRKELEEQFRKTVVLLEPKWDPSTVEAVTRKFRGVIAELNDAQFSAMWSSLGRLLASVHSAVPDPSTLRGLSYKEFVARYKSEIDLLKLSGWDDNEAVFETLKRHIRDALGWPFWKT